MHNTTHKLYLLCFAALLCKQLIAAPTQTPTPIKIIFDTDMDTDCDDAGALAMLHTLADRGEIEILATTVSSRFEWSAPCVDAINRYRGRPEIPIGVPKGEGASTSRGSRYARQIAAEFPCTLRSNADAPSSVEVYRQVLATAPDSSVVIVTVGYLTNLRDLMKSVADKHSPLTGMELIKKKVLRFACMGGRYPEHLNPAVFGNFKPDPSSALAVAEQWPTPIYFSGQGDEVLTGLALSETPKNNPVRRAYELHLGSCKNHPSWDQVTLLYAVRPQAPFWQLKTDGYNHIFENGTNQWRAAPDKDHILIEFSKSESGSIRAIIEELMTAVDHLGTL
ncbi:MAG: nucleoside hydrolase [Kiritimatiellae bacterium]|nr:nucleoside hydrolase [Kiritimatiellia bacterium]